MMSRDGSERAALTARAWRENSSTAAKDAEGFPVLEEVVGPDAVAVIGS